jgi:hypothetical protein
MLVFDVVTPGREARRTWNEGEDWVICVEGRPDPDAGTYRRAMTVFRRRGGAGSGDDCWPRSDEVHDVWLYRAEDVLADLHAAGFAARELDGYGERVRFGRGHSGFAASLVSRCGERCEVSSAA